MNMSLNHMKWAFAALVCSVAAACVTINVYFPEAAAEQAADRFIRDVIGPEPEPQAGALPSPVPAPQERSLVAALVTAAFDVLIPSAHAQSADIDIESPQINAIKARMAERHREHLAGWFDAGAIGFTNDGLVEIRDRSAVGLAERRTLEQVVAAENADRNAVYREIAVANGQPDWEDQIRETFARRWIANARPGWYYQDASGRWQQA
jgi:uncharacterized protein YdbL (DUF1318 family)